MTLNHLSPLWGYFLNSQTSGLAAESHSFFLKKLTTYGAPHLEVYQGIQSSTMTIQSFPGTLGSIFDYRC